MKGKTAWKIASETLSLERKSIRLTRICLHHRLAENRNWKSVLQIRNTPDNNARYILAG